jgi:chaperonin GroES
VCLERRHRAGGADESGIVRLQELNHRQKRGIYDGPIIHRFVLISRARHVRAGDKLRRNANSQLSIRSPHILESKSMHVRPLHDRVIVRRLEEGEQKIGGIIIPDTAKEKPQQGEVIATGNGKVNDDGERVPLDIKAGDLILFGKYASQEVKLDGEEYLIMREDEVLGVIEGGGTNKKK